MLYSEFSSTNMAAGNLLIILETETDNLCLNEPNSDLLASSKFALNFIFSFFELPLCVVGASFSSFNVSKVM